MRYLFVLLIGALMFSLSSLPGGKTAVNGVQRVELSSESDDNSFSVLLDKMGLDGKSDITFGQEVGGKIMDGQLSGSLQEVKERTSRFGTVIPATHKAVITGKLETECEVCGSKISEELRVVENVGNEKDLMALLLKLNLEYARAKKALIAKVAAAKKKQEEEKQLAEDKKECIVDAKGEKIETDEAETRCRLANLRKMKTLDEGREYLEAHLMKKIEGLLNSENPRDREKGEELLRKVMGTRAGRSMQASLVKMRDFATYKRLALADMANYKRLNPSDPRARRIAELIESRHAMVAQRFGGDANFQELEDRLRAAADSGDGAYTARGIGRQHAARLGLEQDAEVPPLSPRARSNGILPQSYDAPVEGNPMARVGGGVPFRPAAVRRR